MKRKPETRQFSPEERLAAEKQANLQRASWQGTPYEPRRPAPEPPPDPRKTRKERPPRKKRRFRWLRRMLAAVLALAAAAFTAYSAAALLAIRHFEALPAAERQLVDAPDAQKGVCNLLVAGVDEHGETDVISIISFCGSTKKLTVTTLLGGSYVSVPGHGTCKLAAAYGLGGAELLMDTVVNSFGIAIDDCLCIGFRGMIALTVAMGGIKLEITDAEAEAANAVLREVLNPALGEAPADGLLPSGGIFQLSGKQLLAYTRIGDDGVADLERVRRQNEVWQLLLETLRKKCIPAANALIGGAVPGLATNISGGRLYLSALTVPWTFLRCEDQALQLPAEGTYSTQHAPDGQEVLAFDTDANARIFADFVVNGGAAP